MGRKAANVVAFNDQAVQKIIRDGKDCPRSEWRVTGVERLVLMTQPGGTGTFYVFYTAAGGVRRKLRLGEYHEDHFKLRDARAAALEALAAIGKGADPVGEAKIRSSAESFQVLAEQFLDSPNLAATTKRNYRQYFEKHVFPIIGKTPASAVTTNHVRGICAKVAKDGAITQSQNVRTAIGGVFRWALDAGLVQTNPCVGIGRRQQIVARTRTPTDEELKKLWKALDSDEAGLSPRMRLILRLAILTGQRRTEVAGASKTELRGLDTENPIWIIPGDVNRRGKVIHGRTKNGREQRVPLSRQAVELFREATELAGESPQIFPADLSKVGKGRVPSAEHINGGSVTSAMRRLRAAAGVEDVSVHDMRRAISNWLKNAGVSREVRDLVLNHVDGSVTEAHYSATARMEQQVKAALQMWADHVERLVAPTDASVSNVRYFSRA